MTQLQCIKRTLINSSAIIDSTVITYLSQTAPIVALTPNVATIITTDATTLNIDVNHDYYIYIYFTSNSINVNLSLNQETTKTGDFSTSYVNSNILNETTNSSGNGAFTILLRNILVAS